MPFLAPLFVFSFPLPLSLCSIVSPNYYILYVIHILAFIRNYFY